MLKFDPHPDVLVLGEHPAAYFAAALLRVKSTLKVLHCAIPGESSPDRVVLVNPDFFDLHAILSPLKRKLDLTAVYGLQFLSDDPATHGEHRGKSALTYTGLYQEIRTAVVKVAEAEGVQTVTPKELELLRLDEQGIDLTVGGVPVRAKAVIVGGLLRADQQRMLGMPEEWERDIVHRYTFARLKRDAVPDLGARPVAPMSLDLHGSLGWAWLLPHGQTAQVCVEQTLASARQTPGDVMLGHWLNVLRAHGVVKPGGDKALEAVKSLDLPLTGAMAHEGVGNRTLMVGPAGGFYSACSEDIYPNCWSALFAADAMKKALKDTHLQDGLQAFRHKWRTTLGDYLRGPQQNLRFLLPLVYRNPVMTARLTESILLGKSVVR